MHQFLKILFIKTPLSSFYFTDPVSTFLSYDLSLFKFSLLELLFSLLLFGWGFFCPHCSEENTLTSSIISLYATDVVISTNGNNYFYQWKTLWTPLVGRIIKGEREKMSPLQKSHAGQLGRSPGLHGSGFCNIDKMNFQTQKYLS